MDHPGLGDDLEDRHPRVQATGSGPGTPSGCRGAWRRARACGMVKRSRPFQSALPESASISRRIALATVDLPEPRLADDGQHLALLQLERHVVQRLEGAVGLAGALDLQHRLAAADRGVHLPVPGGGGDQLAGVGVLGVVVDLGGRAGLDDLARVHHHHPVGHLGDDAEVVGDQHQPEAHLLLQLPEQLQHLGLHGDVERGGRLVGDDDVGLHRQRHGDHHPLALAAGELVRILGARALGLGDADAAHQLERALLGLAPGQAVHAHHLLELPADAIDRVQVAERVLEDHGDAAAVDGAALGGASPSAGRGRRTGSRR